MILIASVTASKAVLIIAAVVTIPFLTVVLSGIAKDARRDADLKKQRSDRLATAHQLLQKGMTCMRERMPLDKGASDQVFTFHAWGGIVLRHEAYEQNDVIKLTIAGDTRLEISIRDGKIEFAPGTTDAEHESARNLLAQLREQEANVA